LEPRADRPTESAESTGTAQLKRPVLVVDDNETVAKALRLLLTDAGFEVAAFQSGLAALRYVEGDPPAAALIDIHLPDINGLILTQRLREKLGPDIPLLVLSGDTSMETLNSLQHVGATYFFPKPLQTNQLIERLKEWVG
jgi:CheY-like chemotaxis protein